MVNLLGSSPGTVLHFSASSSHHPTFLANDTYFEHLALHPDPKLGRVYLGARDRLYQLSFDLQLEAEEETGPVIDSRDCLPPISDTNCPQAKWTNNHNKLLLVDPYSQELISCGSVYQGICQKRSLDSVGKVLFSAERPVDTQYVAANDPNVSTVGLVALTRGRGKQQPVLFVGRGYTNSQPPISTRNLVMEPVFSYEETSKLAVAGRLSEYDHHFVTSFTHRSYVYFMFYRRDLQSPSREYRTYVSRMCLDDTAYYSYVEVPLSCRSAGGKNYNLLQALHVEEVDKRIDATRDLCYTEMGRADGQEVAYIEYEVKSNCANLPTNTLDAYPCGSDHTPSPMASRALVEAEPIFDSPSVRLTAVAVSVREEHTIAFLGDSQGNLHKVEEYAVISIHPSAPISRELRLDHQENHLYILTKKRSVAECEKHLDCQSCLLAHDPYCGWCVLEGKCGLRSECVRGDQKDQWLWSFDIEQQCLSVTFLNPSNISREERRIISLSIPGLPSLERGEHYSCVFQDRSSLAVVTESGVTCSSPHVYTLPSVVINLVMCLDALSFFCSCHGCVQSRWGCNWCVNQHMCTHKAVCDKGLIIYNEHADEGTFVNLGASACPCVEKIQGSSLLPVLTQRKISLLARNLHLYQDKELAYECVMVIEGQTVVVDADVTLNEAHPFTDLYVTLYNCSVGHLDCSRCHTADQKYNCVWCGASCVYRESCSQHIEMTCPAPLIHLFLNAEFLLIVSLNLASFKDPKLIEVSPQRGPKAGGTTLTITGTKLLTGRVTDISVLLGNVPCSLISSVQEETIKCLTGASNRTGEHRVTVQYGNTERHLHGNGYYYTPDPNITHAIPSKSFVGGGRAISVFGQNLDVVQKPQMRVTVVLPDSIYPLKRRRRRRKKSVTDFEEDCEVKTSSLLLCRTPGLDAKVVGGRMLVEFLLDNLRFDFNSVSQSPFIYEPNPILHPLNHRDPTKPYRYKPGSVISVEGENLDLAIFKEEVVALIGEGVCTVKTLTHNHLYCEPPPQQPPLSLSVSVCFQVHMGNLNFSLGQVQYDSPSHSIFPLVAQIGVGVVASLVALIVLIIVFIYRRKSKQALRDYKKVQIQLENLETSVRDRCKKEFTDLMTEMMDMTSDLVGSGIPFLEYRMYAERIFFPGHRESPLRRDLDVQECRRATVEQGLIQLSNLLNSKLFLTKFIHTLESQRTFSPRDRGYVASLLTVALHSKLEYFTDILKTLLNDLVEQYIAKNPKLMLRRTETVVEKLLTNWISICLYAFLRHSAGESLYMLFRAIKHQVDKGPVDAVTGKAKYTLNDNRLLREDLEYRTLTLNVLMQGIGVNEAQPVAAKVLDCDTITQVKEKILDQVYKGTSYSHRPHADSVDLEWRSGVAGHLILSDEDLTSVVHGNWKRLNTLQHYKVPDGANVALVLRQSKHIHHDTHDYFAGEKTPMLEDADEGGVRLWHLVKASEEPELPKHRRGSLKERERAKTIPEIYLTRLLSMKGTLQKFVDDLFTVILSTSQPVPLAIKYFFDLLDDQAVRHGISDSETIHIWKTNSLPLRFWINIVKNPQFIFDVQVSDNVDAVLSVIAQTFMDSCTTTEHKLGRDSPINKLLYARDIPRYKQMVERYYADIKQTISASDQEMNSALAELSRNYSGELNYLVALHELYKYINKYYDQIITALEEDTTAQKMQLGYRLQQIAAAVENKVTDL
uniref:Plexin-B1-like n=1 Tax=Sinocyclocheilus rhinocerous TaxID=307959 RepID=A0A673HKB6_9TELE